MSESTSSRGSEATDHIQWKVMMVWTKKDAFSRLVRKAISILQSLLCTHPNIMINCSLRWNSSELLAPFFDSQILSRSKLNAHYNKRWECDDLWMRSVNASPQAILSAGGSLALPGSAVQTQIAAAAASFWNRWLWFVGCHWILLKDMLSAEEDVTKGVKDNIKWESSRQPVRCMLCF